MKKNIVEKLIILQRGPFHSIAHLLLNIMGLEIPREVTFPADWGGYILITNRQEQFSIQRQRLVEGLESFKELRLENLDLGMVLKKKEAASLRMMQSFAQDVKSYLAKKN